MLSFLSYIVWDADPSVIPGWNVPRWYGLCWALGLIFCQIVVTYVFKKEGRKVTDVDTLTVYIVAGTLIGARLGHILFYNPMEYLSHPLSILKIWEGGLASHGAGIGIFIAIYLYVRTKSDQSYLWVADRIALSVGIIGCMIRVGNFMNSEIVGIPTNNENGVVFARGFDDLMLQFTEIEDIEASKGTRTDAPEGYVPVDFTVKFSSLIQQDIQARNFVETRFKNNLVHAASFKRPHVFQDESQPIEYELTKQKGEYTAVIKTFGVARHPAQLYEAAYSLLIFIILLLVWNQMKEKTPEGLIVGLLLTVLFTLRFLDEYLKENQEAFEEGMSLNMGQILSIPVVLIGLFLLFRAWKNHKRIS